MAPNGDGEPSWNAILALSKARETVRTSRPRRYLVLMGLGGVREVFKECRWATKAVPVKNLRVWSSFFADSQNAWSKKSNLGL